MMTREAMLATIKALGDDVTIFDEDDYKIYLWRIGFMDKERNTDNIEKAINNAIANISLEDDYCLDVTIQDFEGFDKNWREIDRDLDNPEALGAFLEMLEAECSSKEGDFYVTYHFDGFDVEIGYASFDI